MSRSNSSTQVAHRTGDLAALLQTAKQATCNWKLGECASMWTQRWAKGRTDADFGAAIGMSGDQVSQRRRVWDRWGGTQDTYPNLSWSHFYAALNWDDADTYLQWADENQATVAEMKAWRRAQRGEDDPPGRGPDLNELHSVSQRDAIILSDFEQAYRRALAIARLNSVVDRELDAAIEAFSETPLPSTLRQQLRERMIGSVGAWDQALYAIAQTKVTADDED